MKRILPLLVVLALAALSAQAQPGNRMPMQERLKLENEETIKALGLTGAKAETVKTLLDARSEQRAELMRSLIPGDASAGREHVMAERAKQDAELAQKLSGVLTPQQMEKWKALEAERAARPRPRRGGGRNGG